MAIQSASGVQRFAAVGGGIHSGDTVQTATASEIVMIFTDQQRVYLKPGSVFRVDDFEYASDKLKEGRSFLSLVKGGLRAVDGIVGKEAPTANYRVKTPTLTIGAARSIPSPTTRTSNAMQAALARAIRSSCTTGRSSLPIPWTGASCARAKALFEREHIAVLGFDMVFTQADPSYGGNLPVLQNAAGRAGFFNPVIDADGSVCHVPLITEYGGQVYGTLLLQVVRALYDDASVRPVFDD